MLKAFRYLWTSKLKESSNRDNKMWDMTAVLDCLRSLLCTSTGESPQSTFLKFAWRCNHGKSRSEWLCMSGTVVLLKFVRSSKTDDLIWWFSADRGQSHVRTNTKRRFKISTKIHIPKIHIPKINFRKFISGKFISENSFPKIHIRKFISPKFKIERYEFSG